MILTKESDAFHCLGRPNHCGTSRRNVVPTTVPNRLVAPSMYAVSRSNSWRLNAHQYSFLDRAVFPGVILLESLVTQASLLQTAVALAIFVALSSFGRSILDDDDEEEEEDSFLELPPAVLADSVATVFGIASASLLLPATAEMHIGNWYNSSIVIASATAVGFLLLLFRHNRSSTPSTVSTPKDNNGPQEKKSPEEQLMELWDKKLEQTTSNRREED